MSQSEQQGAQSRIRYGSGGWLVAPVFFVLAAWFLWGPNLAAYPNEPVRRISKERIMPVPRRAILGDPPKIMINGFERTCMDCHRTFLDREARSRPGSVAAQGRWRSASTGRTTSCMDCHDYRDRDKLEASWRWDSGLQPRRSTSAPAVMSTFTLDWHPWHPRQGHRRTGIRPNPAAAASTSAPSATIRIIPRHPAMIRDSRRCRVRTRCAWASAIRRHEDADPSRARSAAPTPCSTTSSSRRRERSTDG